MKTNQIMRYWQALYAAHDPGQSGESWELDGVRWSRERHLFWGASHSFRIEFHSLVRPPPKRWHLVVVKELYWGEDREKPLKDTAWYRIDNGNSLDVMAWIEANLPAGFNRPLVAE
jgi:hypothetical protein